MSKNLVDKNIVDMLTEMRIELGGKIDTLSTTLSKKIEESAKAANTRLDGHEIRLRDVEKTLSVNEGSVKGISKTTRVFYSVLLAIMTLVAVILSIKTYNHEVSKEVNIRVEEKGSRTTP
jgi:hypothetical protein